MTEAAERPSKSERKREMHRLQALGSRLIGQKAAFLDKLPLSTRLRAALDEAQRINQREARRRHLQYIGKLMREVPAEDIEEALDRRQPGTQAYQRRQQWLESWRQRLLEDDTELEACLAAFARADRQHLRQLVRNARREAPEEKPSTSARKLLRYLRQLAEES